MIPRSRTVIRSLPTLSRSLLCVLAVLGGCERAGPSIVGRFTVAKDEAVKRVTLGQLAVDPPPREALVSVDGVVERVCPTAGCWLTLRDAEDSDDKNNEPLHVELLGFVMARSREGDRCTVQGKVVQRDGRVTLLATGIRFEH